MHIKHDAQYTSGGARQSCNFTVMTRNVYKENDWKAAKARKKSNKCTSYKKNIPFECRLVSFQYFIT